MGSKWTTGILLLEAGGGRGSWGQGVGMKQMLKRRRGLLSTEGSGTSEMIDKPFPSKLRVRNEMEETWSDFHGHLCRIVPF
ncbi:hypothetical protein GYMLUDRAFT_648586 [Collybiopsis luxurians FD-317 M1]|nr:hypothetical protein GYMLUDRAFT_648586 [Collybiopsis luxurians FD-317 M1]